MLVRKQRITSYVFFVTILMFLAWALPAQQAEANSSGSITANNVNVRSAPSLEGQVIGQLHNGDTITITGSSGDWYQLLYNGQTAYVHKDYARIGATKPNTGQSVKVFVNGKQLAIPIEPPVKQNRVFVPFRAIGEALGVEVTWIAEKKQVIALDQGNEVQFTINSEDVRINGKTIKSSPAPYIVNDYTVLPLRLFSEAFGAIVHWDHTTKTVTVNRHIEKGGNDGSNSAPPPAPNPEPQRDETKATLKEDATVYDAPFTNANIIGNVRSGETITVLNNANGWIEFQYNEKLAYIYAPYIAEQLNNTLTGIVTASELNIRSIPSADGTKLGAFKKGDKVTILDFEGSWAKINYRGQTAYVHAGYLDLTMNEKPYSKLEKPSIVQEAGRDWLVWKKRGYVPTSHKKIAGGVQLTVTAAAIDDINISHPGIQNIEVSGNTIKVLLNNGYHYVARHSTSELRVAILPSGVKGKKIVVDAGHGDHDPGAVGVTGLQEKVVNLDVAQKLAKLLRDAGAEVIMTRSDDTFVSLAGRVKIAHDNNADMFVSIHADSFQATSKGSTTFYHTGNPSWEQSKELAEITIKKLTSALNTTNRGAQNKSLHVIRETEIPAILIELAFLSNKEEEAMLKTDSARQKAAQAIFDSIAEFYK